MNCNLKINIVPLPDGVFGFTVQDTRHHGRPVYHIFINALEPPERQELTYLHEMAHIKGKHFDLAKQGFSVNVLERLAEYEVNRCLGRD